MANYAMRTILTWKEETSPPVKYPCTLTVEHDGETNCVTISFMSRDCEGTELALEEGAWGALMSMLGEVCK